MSGTGLRRPIIAMVTDRHRTGAGRGSGCDMVIAAADRAARAGVDLIQVRERELDDRSLLTLVERVGAAVAGTHTRVVVNDRIDIAIAARADGVHLPARGVSARQARRILPAHVVVGRSVHSVEEARAAERDGGCDYLILGSVFASTSKPAGHAVAGLEQLARVCQSVRLPVLAIGGITAEHAPAIARAGASGVAAIGLFAGCDEEPTALTMSRLRSAFATR